MNQVDLPIAKPCTADWTTMTLADRGRFCGECRKVVRELAQMTEPEARALLASPPTEGLCVRYVHDATGEILFRRDIVPVARLARMKRGAAAAIIAASLPVALAGCMGAPVRPPVMGAPPPTETTMGAVKMGEPPAATPASSTSAVPVVPDAPTPR
jgi:hypothetical protein